MLPVALVCALIAPTVVAQTAGSALDDSCSQVDETIAADRIVGCLESGVPVALRDVTVESELDLRVLRSVDQPLRCIGCTFDLPVKAADVVFGRVVDFSGSTFRGSFDAVGARFQDRFVARSATFQDAVMRGAAFDDIAGFGDAAFLWDVEFDGASFDTAEFTAANFGREASFNDVVVGGDARFALAIFDGSLGLRRASVGGNLDFTSAHLGGGVKLPQAVVGGTTTFEDASVAAGAPIDAGEFRAGALVVPLGLLESVAADEQRVMMLKQVERTAVRNGDLALANDARFLRVSQDSDCLENLFGRHLAGYTVKPIYPLRVLLGLFLVGVVARLAGPPIASRFGKRRAPIKRSRWRAATSAGVGRVRSSAAATLRNVRRRRPEVGERSSFEVVELLAWLVVGTLLVIALGNSNRVARDLIESLI